MGRTAHILSAAGRAVIIILVVLILILAAVLLATKSAGRSQVSGGGQPRAQAPPPPAPAPGAQVMGAELSKEEKIANIDKALANLAAREDLTDAQEGAKDKLVEMKADLEHHWRAHDITGAFTNSPDPYTGYRWYTKKGLGDRMTRGLATDKEINQTIGVALLFA